jgi:hypothetical protein
MEYNYKINLEKLKERYLNKIQWLKTHKTNENKNTYEGMIEV